MVGLFLFGCIYNEVNYVLKMDLGFMVLDIFMFDVGNIDFRLDYVIGCRGILYLDWGLYFGVIWVWV